MGKNFKGLVAAAAVAGAFAAAPAQAAFLQNWFLDYDGGGAAGKTLINEYLDIVGPSVVTTTIPNASGSFNFTEKGAISVTQHDGGASFGSAILGSNQIAALFNISGVGSLVGGTVSYTGGAIDVYYTPVSVHDQFGSSGGTYGVDDAGAGAILIATFSPTLGSGIIDATGVPNGLQTITAAATYMLDGFFFAPDGTTDLSTLVGGPDPLLFGFATTNASIVANPTQAVIDELGGGNVTGCLPGQTTGGCTGVGNFSISNNGQFRLEVIPEPGTLALLGISLLGLGIASRRKV